MCDADSLQQKKSCLKYLHTFHRDRITGRETITHALPMQSLNFISTINHNLFSLESLLELDKRCWPHMPVIQLQEDQ